MKLSIALVPLIVFLLAATVQAAPPPCPGQDGMAGPKCLTITQDQRAKYYALQKEYAPKFREIKDQLFIKENELKALQHAVQPDVPAVRAAATEIVSLRNALADLKKALDERLAKECGIVRPPKPIPGVDCPFPGPKGARPFGPGFHGHHGPQGPCDGPHGPGHFGPHGPGHFGPHGPHGPCGGPYPVD